MPDFEREQLLPAETSGNCRIYLPVLVILVLVFLEKVAYYSLTANLFLFLNEELYHWSFYNAMNALFLFTGVMYIACLFGGFIADTLVGRFVAILLGFLFFSTAYWFLPFLSLNKFPCHSGWVKLKVNNSDPDFVSLEDELCSSTIISILMVAAMGSGMIQANIVPFGVVQGRALGQDFYRMFSNFYYWSVNLGGLIAILVVGYVQMFDFYYGYLVPAVCISTGLILFSLCSPFYTPQPRRSVFSKIYNIIKEAHRSNKRFQKRLAQISADERPNPNNRPSWIDMAKVTYGGKFSESAVDDVKSLVTICIVFFFLVPYWLLYFQMQTSFLSQGLHMRLSFTSQNNSSKHEFMVPAAWLTLFDVLILLISIPVMDRLVYPFLDRRGLRIPLLCRIIIGMVCAASSVLVAALLEHFRYQRFHSSPPIVQVIGNTTYEAADMTIFWQTPQYLLMGLSEIFASIGAVEFACSQSPESMRGIIMGLFYLFTGFGSFLGYGAVSVLKVVNKMHPHYDPNESLLMADYFIYLGSFQVLFMFIFMFVSRHLRIRRTEIVEGPVPARVSLSGSQVSYGSMDNSY